MSGEDFSAERMADEFVNYLYDECQLRRVASWLGFGPRHRANQEPMDIPHTPTFLRSGRRRTRAP